MDSGTRRRANAVPVSIIQTARGAGRKRERMNHLDIDSYRRWLNRQITKVASNHEEGRDTVREAGVIPWL